MLARERFDDVLDKRDVAARLLPFCREDEGRSARAFWATVAPFGVAFAAALVVDSWVLRIPLILLLAGLYARLFVLVHDAEHGAYLRRQPKKRAVLRWFAYAMLSPPHVWREGHSEHHRLQGVYDAGLGGEFPVWTVDHWREAGPVRRALYRAVRAPATMAAGYFTAFLFMSCVAPLVLDPWRNRRCLAALALHGGLVVAAVLVFGWGAALTAILLPMMIAAAAGVYMIYAQHNAPGIAYAGEGARDGVAAALRSTTFFEMGRVMRWFTANIGFHNVHHVAPKIPFYRLPEATAALPEWTPFLIRTSWRWMDMRACLASQLYDPERRRMVTFAAADARRTDAPPSPWFAATSA